MTERKALLAMLNRCEIKHQEFRNEVEIGSHTSDASTAFTAQIGATATFRFDDAGQLLHLELSTGE